MTRKRWIVLGIVLALACLLASGFGAWFLVRTVPGVARLVRGEPNTPTPWQPFRPYLATATLTPTPEPFQELPTLEPSKGPPASAATPSVTATDEVPTEEPTLLSTVISSTLTPLTPTTTLAPPSPTPRPSWIAFETKRGNLGDYEVFAMAPDGSQLSNLTNSWADDVAPAWSPDGRRIAFVSFRHTTLGKSGGFEDGSIYVMDFDPLAGISVGDVIRVTGEGGHDGWPTWSPDGERIAFHSDRGGNWDIWIINSDGSGLKKVTNHRAADRYADWSPDGTKIAFTSGRSGDEDVWVINVDGSNPVNLTKSPERDRYPFWSPDGRQLAFNTNRDGNFEVYVMNADGSNPRNVSKSPKSLEGLADWSPDGKYLVFYSDRPGNKDVFILNLASGQWTNITNDPAGDEFCSWSP